MRQRTVTINGFSKSHAMTGWRLGYLAAPKELIIPMLKIHQYVNTCAPTFMQRGLAEGLRDPICDKVVERMVEKFAARRKLLVKQLGTIPGLRFSVPSGAFYLFLNVSGIGVNGTEFASRLLEDKGVALVPGEGFDKHFVDYVRISYATGEEEIERGVRLIREFVETILKK